jgi:hypothetical protein
MKDPRPVERGRLGRFLASSPTETQEAMNYAIVGLAFAPYVVAAMAAWVLSPAVRTGVRVRLRRYWAGDAGERS